MESVRQPKERRSTEILTINNAYQDDNAQSKSIVSDIWVKASNERKVPRSYGLPPCTIEALTILAKKLNMNDSALLNILILTIYEACEDLPTRNLLGQLFLNRLKEYWIKPEEDPPTDNKDQPLEAEIEQDDRDLKDLKLNWPNLTPETKIKHVRFWAKRGKLDKLKATVPVQPTLENQALKEACPI